MRHRSRFKPIAAIAVSLLLACTRASTPVPTKVGGALLVAPAPSIQPTQFAVVFAGPTGEVAPESEIQIVFSRPVRAMTTVSDSVIPSIELRPAISGTWRWLGTQALVFSPARQRLPYATPIEVTVPAETRAVDGTTLGRAYTFRLRTLAPKLVDVIPSDDGAHLRKDSQFEVVLDQPVELEVLRARLRLEVSRGAENESLPFALGPLAERKNGQGFRLTPKKAMPRAATVRVVVDKGLVGIEGPLSTSDEQAKQFTTVAPLEVKQLECDRATPKKQCDARSGIDLAFNNPVPLRSLRNHLTVDGKRVKFASWYSEDEVTPYIHLPGPFKVGSSITLRVAAGARDDFGQSLSLPFVERLMFDDFFPTMAIGLKGEVFETTQPSAIPIGIVNVTEYEHVFVPLPIEGLAAMLSAEDGSELFARGLKQQAVRYERHSAKYPRNQLGVDSFEPNRSTEPWIGAGLFAVRYPGIDREGNAILSTDARLVQRTNLGISGQVGRHASVIWVTELDTGRSVADAEVSVLQGDGRISATVNTDMQGIAQLGPSAIAPEILEQPLRHPAAIVVKHDREFAFRRLSDLWPEWRIPVPVDRAGQLGTRLMLFAERGLYRPGERIDVKAVLRDELPRGLALPKRRDVKLELMSPENHRVASRLAQISGFGSTSAQFALPLSAATGQWSVRASYGKMELGSTVLTVGEYRPVELEVNVVPAQSELIRGGELRVQVQSRTLFGMAAAGAKARLTAYRERASFVPPGAAAYVTDADAFDESRNDVVLQRAQLFLVQRELDRQGRLEASVSAELPATRGPEWIHFEAEISDAGQNPVAASARSLVHPAAYYVALGRLTDSWVTAPGRIAVAVAAFSPDGTRKIERIVDVELLRRKWSVVRHEVHGVVQSKNEASDEVVGRCQVKTAAVDKSCAFDLPGVGSYFVVARSTDEKNRVTRAAQALFAVGPGQPDFADTDDHRIELVPDKKEYGVGDVAKILVKSAVEDADALVTVGRSDVYLAERRSLKGKTPILEFPIREDMRPNLFVMVNLVTGRKRPPPTRLELPDLGAPTYRMGWTELKIGSTDRRLTVEVRPSTRTAQPGAKVDLAVFVRNQKGQPAKSELTLWAVDEGVLSLGNYQVPDPYSIFLGSRPLQLLPVESRDSLGRRTLSSLREELGLMKGSPGSGGGESGTSSSLRQDFRATAFFLPNLVTDAQGRATAAIRLPDGLTSYRVFALAVSGTEQYGFIADRIVTSKPLMARPTLPRFFRDGDRAEIGVVVSSESAPNGTASVEVVASGLLPKRQEQSARVVRGESTELFFPVSAIGESSSTITINARLGAFRDSVQLTRPLREAIPWEVVAQAGETRERVVEKIGDMSKIRRNRGYLELELQNGFLAGSASGFQQLIEYPYGCSEQIASRLMALLPLADLARSASVELPKDRERLIELAIAELLRRQAHDGGFAMWPDAERSEPWVSAHVLAALSDARSKREYLAPAIERGTEYLRSYATTLRENSLEHGALAALSYVADVLVRLGKGDPGLLSRLYSVRQQLPPFAQALLLHAYALLGHDRKATVELVGEVERTVHHDGALARVAVNVGDDYRRLFDSNTRTSAMTGWALAAAQPDHPLLIPLARGLLSERRNGRWATTQDSAFALLALDAARRSKHLSTGPVEAQVTFGDRRIFSGALGGRAPSRINRRIPVSELEQGNRSIIFEAQQGLLLYEARLHYVPAQSPTVPTDAGFGLERSFVPVAWDGTEMAMDRTAKTNDECTVRATRGQTLIVELSVVVPRPRDFVVLDAPLPAGFEAIDVAHRTSSAWLQQLDRIDAFGPEGGRRLDTHRDLRDDRVVFMVDHFPIGLYRLRYLVRAVTKGHFVQPPARIEAMYAPEHFGATTACAVEIE